MSSALPPTRSLTLESGGTLAYCEVGDPLGEPLFFFHGWPGSRYQGTSYDAQAKKHGLRLLCPDRPGVGGSTFVAGRLLRDWPPVVEELADHLGIGNFSILGVSGGGPYVTACAALIPQRLNRAGVLCGAVVMGAQANMSEMLLSYRVLRGIHQYARPLLGVPIHLGKALTASRSVASLLPLLAGLPKVDREALFREGIFDHELRVFRAAIEFGVQGVVADGEVYLGDWGFDLGSISFPIRFWHGEEDRNIPPSLVKPMIEKIPSAEVTWCPTEGHYSMALVNGFGYWAESD